MASPLVGRAFARSLATTSRTSWSTQHYLRLRAQNQLRTPVTRSFTANARSLEKRYTEDHEWVELSADGSEGTIGVSEYAAKALGDVVFIELPALDLEVKKGDSIGAVESVKSASDIMTPISGVVTETNTALEEKPGTINKSPEGDGWLAKIKVSDAAEVESLMDASAYKTFTEEASDH